MSFVLGKKSLSRLEGVHPDLVKVVKRAIELSSIDFTVHEGLRTIETQRDYVKRGVSKTMNSRHLTGKAVDLYPLVNGKPTFDWKYYYPMAEVMKKAAAELGVSIEWGGDWKTFKDGPHFELNRKAYP